MIWNFLTLLLCLIIILSFRRLDRSNLRLVKLKRYSSKIFTDFKKLADTECRKFNDATIEMDILIKKANSQIINLRESITELENRLEGIDTEKVVLKKAEKDLQIISRSARDVNKQIEFIAASRASFSEMETKIPIITESLSKLERESDAIIHAFNDKVRERSSELSEDAAMQISRIRESVQEEEVKILESTRENVEILRANFSDSLLNMDQQITTTGESILENITFKIDTAVNSVDLLEKKIESTEQRVISDLNTKVNHIEKTIAEVEKMDGNIEKMHNKIKNVEENIDESKSRLIETFEEEVNKVRAEIDNLDIHTISKKDEIVKAARKEAEDIKFKIEDFEKKYTELETNIVETVDGKLGNIISEYQSIETRFNNLIDKLTTMEDQYNDYSFTHMEKTKNEFSSMEQRLSNIRDEILHYEENKKIFSRTDEMFKKVDDAIADFNRILEDAKYESRNLEKFTDDVERIKDLRITVEREIKTFESRKEKIKGFENDTRALLELTEFVITKSESLEDNISKINQTNTRIDTLAESYISLESRIAELNEYDDTISRNLDSIQKTEMIATSIEGKIKTFQSIVDRSDKRIQKLTEYLSSTEEKTLILKSREQEIRVVEDKFNELEGLSLHIEKRIDQIHAMFQKVESIREEIDETDNKLKRMFTETDQKIRQFADFLQAVENNNPISKQLKGDIPIGKNINDSIIQTIRELSTKGWSSYEISKKLLIDENAVRLIINTASL